MRSVYILSISILSGKARGKWKLWSLVFGTRKIKQWLSNWLAIDNLVDQTAIRMKKDWGSRLSTCLTWERCGFSGTRLISICLNPFFWNSGFWGWKSWFGVHIQNENRSEETQSFPYTFKDRNVLKGMNRTQAPTSYSIRPIVLLHIRTSETFWRGRIVLMEVNRSVFIFRIGTFSPKKMNSSIVKANGGF